MAWDFETDPEFQKKLDWIEDFMADKVEPISHLGMAAFSREGREKFIKPLQDEVRAQGLWACHLGPESLKHKAAPGSLEAGVPR